MQTSIRLALVLFAVGCIGTTTDKTDTTDATDMSGTTATTGDSGATNVDADKDGVLAADDCDDNDASLGAIADDADCDGTLTKDDCDDNDATLNDLDADKDGLASCDGDCDDASADIHPDSAEIPGNGTDENCDDSDTAAVVLNEMLFDPAGGTPANPGDGGDANYDGIRDAQGDEFVELVNTEDFSVDLSGFMMWDQDYVDDKSKEPRHLVPKGTILAPGQALVVFGFGTPGIDNRKTIDKKPNPNFGKPTFDFGGSIVQVTTSGLLNLNNGGDVFYLQDSLGNEFLTRDIKTFPEYAGGTDQSHTRNPDLTGKFVLHTNAVKGVLQSPGTRTDGTAF